MERKILYCLLVVFCVSLLVAGNGLAVTAKADNPLKAVIKKLTMPELPTNSRRLTAKEKLGSAAEIRVNDLWFNSRGEKIDLRPYLSTQEFVIVMEKAIYGEGDNEENYIRIQNYFSMTSTFELVRKAERGDYYFLLYSVPDRYDREQFLSFLSGLNHQLATDTIFHCLAMPVFYLPGEGARALTGNLLITIRDARTDDMVNLAYFLTNYRLQQDGIKMHPIADTLVQKSFDHLAIVARITAETKKNIFSLSRLVEDSPNAVEKETKEFFRLNRGKVEAIPELVRIPGALHVEASIEEPTDPYVGSTWNYVMKIEGDRDTAILMYEFEKDSVEMREFREEAGLPEALLLVGKPIIERSAPNGDNRARMIIKLPLTILKPGSRKLPGFTLRYSFSSEVNCIDAGNYTAKSYSHKANELQFYVPVLAVAKMTNVYPPAFPDGVVRALGLDPARNVAAIILAILGIGFILWSFIGRQKKIVESYHVDTGPRDRMRKLLGEFDSFFDNTADIKTVKHELREMIASVEEICDSGNPAVQAELQSWRDDILARQDAYFKDSLPAIKARLRGGLEKIINTLPEGG